MFSSTKRERTILCQATRTIPSANYIFFVFNISENALPAQLCMSSFFQALFFSSFFDC